MYDLNDDTVLIYAIKSYESLNYVKSEFQEDYKAFKYIKRLLQRYRITGEMREKLILNHLNLIYNVFGVEAGTRILFYKIEEQDYSALKTFCIFLNTMPDRVQGIKGKDIISASIQLDVNLVEMLRKI